MMNRQDINTVMNQCRVELTGVSDALLKSGDVRSAGRVLP
jgi:hypothetical protein